MGKWTACVVDCKRLKLAIREVMVNFIARFVGWVGSLVYGTKVGSVLLL